MRMWSNSYSQPMSLHDIDIFIHMIGDYPTKYFGSDILQYVFMENGIALSFDVSHQKLSFGSSNVSLEQIEIAKLSPKSS